MNFRGKAKRLDDVDLPKLGATIGVGEDEIHAVLDVEAAGSGFDSHGRPKMLFEPHVFYRNLTGAQLTAAVSKGLAYKNWKPGAYPKDSYPRLEAAIAINEEAAFRSASWGLGQILGENHELAGYSSAKAMALDFLDDEETHLQAMVTFIKTKKLDVALRAHDWDKFAAGYNGAGYRKNNYHIKLAQAFTKWQLIPDTPWPPKAVIVDPRPVPVPPAITPKPEHWLVRLLRAIFRR